MDSFSQRKCSPLQPGARPYHHGGHPGGQEGGKSRSPPPPSRVGRVLSSTNVAAAPCALVCTCACVVWAL
jgi:hypothetical protein